ncbi:ABC transporter permease [Leifsonia sp. TF02-11]|uniref:ABC transporter permease n=1 Tax=Leifsonia sp. TF02-11 TaxID=2815212 RepID=UPI001AA1460F|nr:ABC transporter permease [Leifsonia sp. TF02-11]MBO1740612.1 ABC transporter permease [Leifsonia sp. TF02-11]
MTAQQAAAVQPVDDRAITSQPRWKTLLSVNWLWLLALNVGMILLFGALSPGNVFWSVASLQSLLLNGTETLLLALAITMLLGAGLIDISVGANLVLSSVIGAAAMKALFAAQLPPALSVATGILVCLLSGMAFGAVNGFIVSTLGVNSLITTLGTTGVGTGIALLLTGGTDISGLPPELQSWFSLNSVLGIPLPGLVAVIAVVAVWFAFRYTRFGSRTLAIGSSEAAAFRAGIPVKSQIFTLMIIGGLLAGIAGFVDVSRYTATVVSGHVNDPLAAITAAVIGGSLLEGGRVSVLGTVMGAALSVILLGGLTVISVSSFWQLVITGVILIFAVAIDRLRYRRRTQL